MNEKIHVRHILCEKFQGKCKFVENIACVHDLHKISAIAVKFGLIKGYHEIGKGKFLVTATARFNNYTGYFWGFHQKRVYKFHVNQIQFIFELAFDRNKKHYPQLVNAYPSGNGEAVLSPNLIITKEYKNRFHEDHISNDFCSKIR